MCEVSRLPSIACTQLQVVTCLVAMNSAASCPSVPKSLKGVIVSRGPMYVQTMPPDSWVGYALIRTLSQNGCGSLGMSTHRPSASNAHPW